jgi:hypothetical protein
LCYDPNKYEHKREQKKAKVHDKNAAISLYCLIRNLTLRDTKGNSHEVFVARSLFEHTTIATKEGIITIIAPSPELVIVVPLDMCLRRRRKWNAAGGGG